MVLLVFLRSLSVTSVLLLDESHHDCSLSKFQSFVKIPVTYQSSHGLESHGFDTKMESLSSKILPRSFHCPESTPIDEAIRQIVEADDTKVKYVNDLLGEAELDEF